MNFSHLIKLLTSPCEYWNEIIAAPGDIKTLLVPQILILAAIPAVCSFLGTLFVFSFIGFGQLILSAFLQMILAYGFQIGSWILLGVIINLLAEPFGAQKDFAQAMKLATGTIIPLCLAGLLYLIPILGFLGLLGGLAYGAYVLYIGLPIMNATPQDKAIVYVAAVIGIMLFVSIVFGFIASCPVNRLTAASLISGFRAI